MFKKNNVNVEQTSLFSKMDGWTEYKKKLIKRQWPEFFRSNIMINIDEEPYGVLYSLKGSRPNTPVNYLVGLLIIKSLMGLSDEELLNEAIFNERIQYALGTLDYERQPISKNDISNFRVKIYNYEKETGINLFDNTIKELNKKIIEISKIDHSLKRIDSVMISSSCKQMTRTELIYKVNERMIKLLRNLNIKIREKRLKKYLEEGNSVEVLYKTKEEEIGGKLNMLLKHSIVLYNDYKNNEKVNNTEEYLQLKRLIEDQYDSTNNTPKSGKNIKPTSMQTPYDEKATYRFKYENNIGYVGNFVETVDREKELNLVSNWDVAPNIKSDKEFMLDIIDEKKQNKNMEKETYITDAAYFSIKTNSIAKKQNIELHPTDMTGKTDIKETNLSDFEINKEKEIIKCPNGNKPISTNYNETNNIVYADFEKTKCSNCPLRDKCPIKEYKNKNKLSVKIDRIEFSKVLKNKSSKEYKELSKLRSGVEGIPSVLRRKYKIDNRTTKGLVYLKFVFSTSMLSINIKRMVKYNQKKIKEEEINKNENNYNMNIKKIYCLVKKTKQFFYII